MPGESRGTLRAAPCACVELISSPPSLLPSSHPSVPSPSFAFPSAGSARGEYGVPRDLAPLPLRAHSSSSSSIAASLPPPLPLLYVFSPYLTPVYRRSLSFAVVSSSSSSLHGSFSFLRCCVLHSRYWHPLIKPPLLFPPLSSLLSICLHLAPYLHLSSFSPCARFTLFLQSGTCSSSFFVLSSYSRAFHILRLASYIPDRASANKAVFRKLLRILRKFFGELAFP